MLGLSKPTRKNTVTAEISNDGKGFLLRSSMRVPRPREDVFAFFADARNLQRITPSSLHFDILTKGPIEMREGTRIDYRLRVHRIPLRWRSAITAWEPPYRFVDEQEKGPYRRWIHEHTFEEEGDSTLVHDRIRYRIFGGGLINRLFVSRDLRSIFEFRARALRDIFAGDSD
jgi:ligand-binding SRPBCC domain-containing protein